MKNNDHLVNKAITSMMSDKERRVARALNRGVEVVKDGLRRSYGIKKKGVKKTKSQQKKYPQVCIIQTSCNKSNEELLIDYAGIIDHLDERFGDGEYKLFLNAKLSAIINDLSSINDVIIAVTQLASSDFVIFGKGWQDDKGCVAFEDLCRAYHIPYKLMDFDPHKTVIGRRLDAGLFD